MLILLASTLRIKTKVFVALRCRPVGGEWMKGGRDMTGWSNQHRVAPYPSVRTADDVCDSGGKAVGKGSRASPQPVVQSCVPEAVASLQRQVASLRTELSRARSRELHVECAECRSPLLDIKFSPALRCKIALCGLCASVPATKLKVSVAYAPTDRVESSTAESEELLRALTRDLQQRLKEEKTV